ncbi:MAG TPA: helix-turn-helix transcriptional regulator [Jatrophihabitantaceae bacterium]|jgi:transcriptional regulator with XRE-family HTH domain
MASRIPPRIATPIRERLARHGLRQTDLAERLGERQNWVSKRLTGAVPFRLDDLERIAKALDTNVSELCGDELERQVG